MRQKLRAIIALACGGLWLALAQAADIYQWVDESGRTQLSDTVPEKYKGVAKKVDSRRFEVTAQDRAAAQARAARDQERAAAGDADARGARAPRGAGAAAAASAAASGNAAAPAGDCAARREQYMRSQECFAPFRNVNGSLKPGAYDKCVEVPDPSPTCGLVSRP